MLTPRIGELRQVDVELRFAQAAAVGEVAGRVRDCLQLGLPDDVLSDGLLEIGVVLVGGKVLDQGLEHQATIPCPGIKV